MTSPFPTMTLPEIVGEAGLLTDGDWVESKDQDESGTIRLTQLADVGDGAFLDRSDRWLNEEQAARLGVTYLAPGDVLVARMPDPLGRACVCPALPTRAITVVDVCVVRAPAHNARWIMHALNAPQTRSRVAGLQSGSTRKRISKGNLSTIPIPMPPRDTQDRLVAAIDMHLSRLDAAVASLTRAKANVANARASVLKAAVEGRLVPTEAELARTRGREYEAAAVLVAHIQARRQDLASTDKAALAPAVLAPADLPEGWAWMSVDQAASVVRNGFPGKPGTVGPVRILRISSVRPGRVDVNDCRWLDGSQADYIEAVARPGDLLATRYNGTPSLVGVVGLLRGTDPLVHPDKLIRIALAAPPATSRWFEIALNAGRSRAFIRSRIRTTAGQAGISGADLRATPVPLPPLAEQVRICNEVDRRLSVLDAVERDVDASLAHCAQTRQAILKKAFEGRLVPLTSASLPVAPRPDGPVEVVR